MGNGLASITSEDFPDELLLVCYNPLVAAARSRRRMDLLASTEADVAVMGSAYVAGKIDRDEFSRRRAARRERILPLRCEFHGFSQAGSDAASAQRGARPSGGNGAVGATQRHSQPGPNSKVPARRLQSELSRTLSCCNIHRTAGLPSRRSLTTSVPSSPRGSRLAAARSRVHDPRSGRSLTARDPTIFVDLERTASYGFFQHRHRDRAYSKA